jgi:Fur family peroxide stress response transcriptional regulator
MKVDRDEIERRMKRFEQVCRDAGAKLTHQRLEVFREVAQSGDHPDAETVYRRVRRRLPTVSLDTVYRTLWLITDLGLINTLGSPRERVRFDANLSRHHHFVCVHCGMTRDFCSDAFDGLKLPAAVKAYGRVETTDVEARGVCRACGNKSEADGHPSKSRKPGSQPLR